MPQSYILRLPQKLQRYPQTENGYAYFNSCLGCLKLIAFVQNLSMVASGLSSEVASKPISEVASKSIEVS